MPTERGIDARKMKMDRMREVLGSHPDFRDEKLMLERLLVEKGHIMYYLPKFHCELNPTERVWAQAKQYSRAHCKYTITSLRRTVHPALDSVFLENIQNHFRKIRHYMFAYLEGNPGGSKLENLLRNIKVSSSPTVEYHRLSKQVTSIYSDIQHLFSKTL